MAIEKVAVLGAGVLGQGIAAHLANAGIPSLLFDIAPKEGTDPRALAKAGIANVGKLKPPAMFRAADVALISPCNYDSDASRLAEMRSISAWIASGESICPRNVAATTTAPSGSSEWR